MDQSDTTEVSRTNHQVWCPLNLTTGSLAQMGLRGPTGPRLGIPEGNAGDREGNVQVPNPLLGDEIREAYYTTQ